jgi:4-amino-4-deoxy-L-arabinose transferase-like glycosyltransferase
MYPGRGLRPSTTILGAREGALSMLSSLGDWLYKVAGLDNPQGSVYLLWSGVLGTPLIWAPMAWIWAHRHLRRLHAAHKETQAKLTELHSKIEDIDNATR